MAAFPQTLDYNAGYRRTLETAEGISAGLGCEELSNMLSHYAVVVLGTVCCHEMLGAALLTPHFRV